MIHKKRRWICKTSLNVGEEVKRVLSIDMKKFNLGGTNGLQFLWDDLFICKRISANDYLTALAKQCHNLLDLLSTTQMKMFISIAAAYMAMLD